MAERDTLLAVDIGNTQVVAGVLRGAELLGLFRLTSQVARTADELVATLEPLLLPHLPELRMSRRVAIASVVPALTGAYEEYAMRRLGARPLLVSARLPRLPIRIDVPDPTSVGADRIANAVAAAALYPLPVIVVDLGTATTFDVVLPGARYVGGVIAPGVWTSAEELFRRGARLAKVELRVPERVVGRTTEASVQSGVLYGAAGQIDGILARISKELSIRPRVVATGGLAPLIAMVSKSLTTVDPGLTLQGLRILEERSQRPSGQPARKAPRRSARKG
ncbi:MAG: type III pantothenate kinase [Candidatus Eisenbacteria bacterium]